MKPTLRGVMGCAAVFGTGVSLILQAAASPGPWQHRLLDGSMLIDDCLICGRPTIQQPMRGTYQLRWVAEDPLFAEYAVEDVAFTAGASPGPEYRVTGRGTWRIGGEVALQQEMTLEVQIDNGFTQRSCVLTNVSATVDRLWPMLAVSLEESNKTDVQFYRFELASAPLREIWFSTSAGLTPANWSPPTNHISGGDLISDLGRIVERNEELTRYLGIMPVVPDLGLDALEILPGGEIAFSTRQDATSESLGPLSQGDLLSQRGQVLHRNADLLQAFNPQPPVPDVGLDAVHVRADGEVWFSITTDLFSEKLGETLRRGDLLSSSGRIVKHNQELLARFQPADPAKDHGLDALYVWPSGEIWFSVETGFADLGSNQYGDGDLLSDQGYVVYRNLELTGAFAPTEDLANFGLDALFVVTDVVPPTLPPSITSFSVNPQTGTVSLQGEGRGQVFQLEGADDVVGTWRPLAPITPSLNWEWIPPHPGPAQTFFRLRQW
jgi:hypothetical protein